MPAGQWVPGYLTLGWEDWLGSLLCWRERGRRSTRDSCWDSILSPRPCSGHRAGQGRQPSEKLPEAGASRAECRIGGDSFCPGPTTCCQAPTHPLSCFLSS